MPIYEYECTRCGDRTEAVQKVDDPPLRKCKSCGGPLKKIISAPAIHFKGSGWYITDYARKSSPEREAKGKDRAKSGDRDAGKAASEKKPPASAKD